MKSFIKVYLDYGDVVFDYISRGDGNPANETEEFYLNHKQVDKRVFLSALNDRPEGEDEEERWRQVDAHTAIANLYNGGTAIILDDDGYETRFCGDTFSITNVSQFTDESYNWFVPIQEYKKIKEKRK